MSSSNISPESQESIDHDEIEESMLHLRLCSTDSNEIIEYIIYINELQGNP